MTTQIPFSAAHLPIAVTSSGEYTAPVGLEAAEAVEDVAEVLVGDAGSVVVDGDGQPAMVAVAGVASGGDCVIVRKGEDIRDWKQMEGKAAGVGAGLSLLF